MLNAGEPRELVVGFCRPTSLTQTDIQGTDVGIVDSSTYLVIHLNHKLDWTHNNDHLHGNFCVCMCLKVMFEDVIAEPPSVRSFDKVWLWSHALFEVSRLWCYRFISLVLAVPVSLAAGLLFAVLSCLHIWLIMPCVQLLLINMQWIQTVWASILNIFISPFFSSAGKCCSQIIIHLAKQRICVG
uniref:Caveolin n=1 Tax=Fundulus heteroclitus TaxID=8078 RepID=A0A3Q2Q0H6_FUNHE